jgi:Family of unknown function (DUF5906)
MSGQQNMTNKIEDDHFTLDEAKASHAETMAALRGDADEHPTLNEAKEIHKRTLEETSGNVEPTPTPELTHPLDTENPRLIAPQDSDKWFNRHFFVATENGKTQIYRQDKDGSSEPYINDKDFFGAYSHIKLTVKSQTPNDVVNERKVPAARHWYNDYPDRRTYYNTIFDPRGGAPSPLVLNRWPGFGLKGVRSADTEWRFVVFNFIRDIICSHDHAAFKYAIKWIAHLLQKPWEKPSVSLVLIGTKGTGKSLFFKMLHRLIDGFRDFILFHKTVKESDFTGNFNDHLKNKIVLILDEASYIGAPKILATINDFISSEHQSIGTKFASTKMSIDYLRVVMGANPPWRIPLTWDERRHLVLTPSQENMGDQGYYTRVANAISDIHVLEALHYFFQHVDISDFNTHVIPHTDAMMKQRISGLKGVEAWAFELATDGFIDAWDIKDDAYVLRDVLRKAYNEWHKARYDDKKEISPTQFGMEFGRLLPALDERGNVILKNGQVVNILEENRQRNSTLLKLRPDLNLDETKFSYLYVLPSLWSFRNLLKISLKIQCTFNSANSWGYLKDKTF